jgi:hypothetical protein
MIKKSLLIVFCLLSIAICSFVFAADSEVTLDTTDSSSGFAVKDSVGTTVFRAGGDGNVGIGMTSPSEKLEIGGTAGVDGIKFPDGTMQTTAASGDSSNYFKVNGIKTKVYTEYFTGTLDNDDTTLVVHEIADYHKILNCKISLFSSDNNKYYYQEGFMTTGASATNAWSVHSTATNIEIKNVGTRYRGQNYRVKMEYTE